MIGRLLARLRTILLRILLKISWSVGGKRDAIDGLPRILSTAGLAPLLGVLQPGDLVLLGNNGRLSHIAVYIGAGEIIHAMATEKTMRGWLGSMRDAIGRSLGTIERHVGVLREPLAGFVDRYERDTWMVVRANGLDSERIGRGMTRIGELVGKPYDYGFKADNEAWYCTEIAVAFLEAALGRPPTLTARRVHVPLLIDEAVIEPEALLDAEGVSIVGANRAADSRYGERLRTAGVAPA
jgi:hypothetical protein